jgi:hypothetical protein
MNAFIFIYMHIPWLIGLTIYDAIMWILGATKQIKNVFNKNRLIN